MLRIKGLYTHFIGQYYAETQSPLDSI